MKILLGKLVELAASVPKYELGNRIVINYGTMKEPEYYPATITKINSDQATVAFDDGTKGVYTIPRRTSRVGIIGLALTNKPRKTAIPIGQLGAWVLIKPDASGDIYPQTDDPRVWEKAGWWTRLNGTTEKCQLIRKYRLSREEVDAIHVWCDLNRGSFGNNLDLKSLIKSAFLKLPDSLIRNNIGAQSMWRCFYLTKSQFKQFEKTGTFGTGENTVSSWTTKLDAALNYKRYSKINLILVSKIKDKRVLAMLHTTFMQKIWSPKNGISQNEVVVEEPLFITRKQIYRIYDGYTLLS